MIFFFQKKTKCIHHKRAHRATQFIWIGSLRMVMRNNNNNNKSNVLNKKGCVNVSIFDSKFKGKHDTEWEKENIWPVTNANLFASFFSLLQMNMKRFAWNFGIVFAFFFIIKLHNGINISGCLSFLFSYGKKKQKTSNQINWNETSVILPILIRYILIVCLFLCIQLRINVNW